MLSSIMTSPCFEPFRSTVADPLAKPLKVAVVAVPRVPLLLLRLDHPVDARVGLHFCAVREVFLPLDGLRAAGGRDWMTPAACLIRDGVVAGHGTILRVAIGPHVGHSYGDVAAAHHDVAGRAAESRAADVDGGSSDGVRHAEGRQVNPGCPGWA